MRNAGGTIIDEGAIPGQQQGRPQSADLDRAIREAALHVLAEVGAEALRISSVARRAKTTTAAIYRRFSNKSELLVAAIELDMAKVANSSLYTDHGSLQNDLLAWVGSIFDAYSSERTYILASLSFQARVNHKPLDLLAETIHRLGSSHWREIIRRAVERGELDHPEIPEMIGRMPGGIAMHLAMFRELPQDTDALKSDLVDAVMLPALFAASRNPRSSTSGTSES